MEDELAKPRDPAELDAGFDELIASHRYIQPGLEQVLKTLNANLSETHELANRSAAASARAEQNTYLMLRIFGLNGDRSDEAVERVTQRWRTLTGIADHQQVNDHEKAVLSEAVGIVADRLRIPQVSPRVVKIGGIVGAGIAYAIAVTETKALLDWLAGAIQVARRAFHV